MALRVMGWLIFQAGARLWRDDGVLKRTPSYE